MVELSDDGLSSSESSEIRDIVEGKLIAFLITFSVEDLRLGSNSRRGSRIRRSEIIHTSKTIEQQALQKYEEKLEIRR